MTITVATRQSASARMHSLLTAYEASPMGGEVCFRIGNEAGGTAAILVSFDGRDFPLLAWEARGLAKIMRETIKQFSIPGNMYGIKQMADGLVDAARRAERGRP